VQERRLIRVRKPDWHKDLFEDLTALKRRLATWTVCQTGGVAGPRGGGAEGEHTME
jgi:hypothetical protein